MNNRYLVILEIIWAGTSIACIAVAIKLLVTEGYGTRFLLLAAMALIAFLFAWYRHRQRKKN